MLLLSSVDHVLILVGGGLALALARRRFPTFAECLDTRDTGWRVPVAVGLLVTLVVLWVWWPSRTVPVVHDEAAYLLQSELLARGRFATSPPLLPELSEQAAVLVSPVLAPKPMPGQAIALLPGVAIGLPWLMPALLSGATAAAIFIIVRAVVGVGPGLLAVMLWISAPGVLRWQPSYFSEVTSTALMLAGWLTAWRWWGAGRTSWLVACAVTFAVLAITRPLTAVAQAVPIALIVLYRMQATRRWHQLVPALLIGGVPLLLVPIQSKAVTGSWGQTPWGLYAEQYIPWDHPGFGFDDTPPTRRLPPDLDAAMAEFRLLHQAHTPGALPSILTERVRAVWRHQTVGWRGYLLPLLVLVGAAASWRLGLLVAATAGLQFGVYLSYAHQPHWTLYYAELIPLLMILGAVGVARIERIGQTRVPSPSLVSCGVAVLLLLLTIPTFARQRRQHLAVASPWLTLNTALGTTGEGPRLVYVRYGSSHDPHKSLVRNSAEGGAGLLHLLHEPSAEQDRVLQLRFPAYATWLYDVETETIRRLR